MYQWPYPAENTPNYITHQARCAHWCNSGMSLMGATKCSLVGSVAYSTRKNTYRLLVKTHGWGRGVWPQGIIRYCSAKPTVHQLLLKSCVCAHRQMLPSVSIRETAMKCSKCRHSWLFKTLRISDDWLLSPQQDIHATPSPKAQRIP